jgi:hypothetical protein
MNRRARVDAVYTSVRSIEDADAFSYVIEREPDDGVLSDLRDRFWNGRGEKPWQVKEINRLLTRRKEQRSLGRAAPTQKGDGERPEIEVARITSRQAIAVAAITAVAGVIGIAIGRSGTGNTGASPAGIGQTRRECTDYRLTVRSPRLRDTVEAPFVVSGRSDSLPTGFKVWIFTRSTPGRRDDYWPVAASDVIEDDWRITVPAGSSRPGDDKYFAVFLVGPDGHAVIDYYRQAMRARWADTAAWEPMTRRTADMVECKPTHVVRLK